MLAFLPAGAQPDYAGWRSWMAQQAQKKGAALPPVDPTKLIMIGETEPNGTQGTADFIAGFGTGVGDDAAADVTAALTNAPPTILAPFAEDDGSIPLASATGLVSGAAIKVSQVLGDGPVRQRRHRQRRLRLLRDRRRRRGRYDHASTSTPWSIGSPLDPFVVVWDSAGTLLAFNDDFDSLDSFVSYTAPAAGYLLRVGRRLSEPGTDRSLRFVLGLRLRQRGVLRRHDRAQLRRRRLLQHRSRCRRRHRRRRDRRAEPSCGCMIPPLAQRIGSQQDAGFIVPGPFPTGNAAFAYVVETAGTYAVRVSRRQRCLHARSCAPSGRISRGSRRGTVQTLFIDFNGATIDPAIFGNPPGSAMLSPLSSFLSGWGLTPADENDVIDAILAAVEESLSTDMRVLGLNGDFDVYGDPGRLRRRHSQQPRSRRSVRQPERQPRHRRRHDPRARHRDHRHRGVDRRRQLRARRDRRRAARPAERAGLRPELAQSVRARRRHDDLRPDRRRRRQHRRPRGRPLLRQLPHRQLQRRRQHHGPGRQPAQHGRRRPGPDAWAPSDDTDVDFGADIYVPNEGFTGVEDTLNAVAFDLSTSAARARVRRRHGQRRARSATTATSSPATAAARRARCRPAR